MMVKARLVAAVVGLSTALVFDPVDATLIIIKGRPVDSSDVRGPFAPSNTEECDTFKKDANETLKDIGDAHDQCLEHNRGHGGGIDSEIRLPDGRKVARCSVAFCQDLHTARDEYREKVGETYSRCLVEVGKRYGGAASREARSTTTSKEDELNYARRKFLGAPIDGVVEYVKLQVSAVIDKYFISHANLIGKGLQASDATSFFWRSAQDIRAQCAAAHDTRVQAKCNEQLIDAFSSLPGQVPTEFRYDPAIGVIQRAMIEKLQLVMQDMNANLQEVQQGMNDIQDNSPAAASSSRRRSHKSPLIENR